MDCGHSYWHKWIPGWEIQSWQRIILYVHQQLSMWFLLILDAPINTAWCWISEIYQREQIIFHYCISVLANTDRSFCFGELCCTYHHLSSPIFSIEPHEMQLKRRTESTKNTREITSLVPTNILPMYNYLINCALGLYCRRQMESKSLLYWSSSVR